MKHPAGYRLIEENQLVGDGTCGAIFRNLYENAAGDRISIPTSRGFIMQDQRKPGERYPETSVLFERFRLTTEEKA